MWMEFDSAYMVFKFKYHSAKKMILSKTSLADVAAVE